VIDQAEMTKALRSGHLGGAASTLPYQPIERTILCSSVPKS